MLHAHVNRFLAGPAAKPLFFFLLLLPLAWLVYGAVFDRLGANPAEALVRSTGDWTLRMLCLVLLVTPLRVVVGLPALARLRRMVGLFVFFYVLLHFFAYGWLDMGLDLEEIAKDIPKRPFILVGFAALLLLTSLAVTSFNAAIHALGAKRWRQPGATPGVQESVRQTLGGLRRGMPGAFFQHQHVAAQACGHFSHRCPAGT